MKNLIVKVFDVKNKVFVDSATSISVDLSGLGDLNANDAFLQSMNNKFTDQLYWILDDNTHAPKKKHFFCKTCGETGRCTPNINSSAIRNFSEKHTESIIQHVAPTIQKRIQEAICFIIFQYEPFTHYACNSFETAVGIRLPVIGWNVLLNELEQAIDKKITVLLQEAQ